MRMIHLKIVSSLTACILVALFATPALAHNGVAHETDAEADAHMNVQIDFPTKPLDIIKARARQIQSDAMNARIELRADTRVQLQGASSSGERKDVVRNFVGERVDIAKARFASTTAPHRKVKDAIHWHGGLIRERFVVAIRQFDKIVTRIESRIEKLQAEGVATVSVEAELALAEIAIATAKVDAQAVADFVANVEDSSDRAAVKAELEAKIRTAQASIKAAHQALVKTVRALVALKPTVDANATTSVETSTE